MLLPLWLLWALIPNILWAMAAILEKAVLQRHTSYLIPILVCYVVFKIFPLTLMVVAVRPDLPGFWEAILSFFAGFILFASNYYYFRALLKVSATVVTCLFQLTTMFTIIFGAALSLEFLGNSDFLGIGIILISAIILSIDPSENIFEGKLNRGLHLMIVSTFLYASQATLVDYVLQTASPSQVFTFSTIGEILCALVVLGSKKVRQGIRALLKTHRVQIPVIMFILAFMLAGAAYTLARAYELGSLSLVTVVVGTQPFFTLLLSLLVMKFIPGVLNESYTKKEALYKLPAMAFMVGGVYLISG